MDTDAVCWVRAIIEAEFRCTNIADSTYLNSHIRWERRTLSVLGRFIPYHLHLCYNLTETAPDRVLARILLTYDRLALWQGFLIEQEPIFTYKSSMFSDDPGTRLWVVACTERVVLFAAVLLLVSYR